MAQYPSSYTIPSLNSATPKTLSSTHCASFLRFWLRSKALLRLIILMSLISASARLFLRKPRWKRGKGNLKSVVARIRVLGRECFAKSQEVWERESQGISAWLSVDGLEFQRILHELRQSQYVKMGWVNVGPVLLLDGSKTMCIRIHFFIGKSVHYSISFGQITCANPLQRPMSTHSDNLMNEERNEMREIERA